MVLQFLELSSQIFDSAIFDGLLFFKHVFFLYLGPLILA